MSGGVTLADQFSSAGHFIEYLLGGAVIVCFVVPTAMLLRANRRGPLSVVPRLLRDGRCVVRTRQWAWNPAGKSRGDYLFHGSGRAVYTLAPDRTVTLEFTHRDGRRDVLTGELGERWRADDTARRPLGGAAWIPVSITAIVIFAGGTGGWFAGPDDRGPATAFGVVFGFVAAIVALRLVSLVWRRRRAA